MIMNLLFSLNRCVLKRYKYRYEEGEEDEKEEEEEGETLFFGNQARKIASWGMHGGLILQRCK